MRIFLLSCCLGFFAVTLAQLPINNNDESSSGILKENISQPIQQSNKFSFGLHLSPAISWLNVEHNDLKTDGATITGGLGLIAEYNINMLFSLVSGFNLNMPCGYTFDSLSMNDITTRNNFLLKFHTLEVPILMKIKTSPIDKIIYYTQGGLNVGYRISSKELHHASSKLYNDYETSFNSFSTPFQLSYSIGFGASYNIKKRHRVFGEINYKNSLMNIASENGFTTSGRYTLTQTPEIYSGNMTFTLGVMF